MKIDVYTLKKSCSKAVDEELLEKPSWANNFAMRNQLSKYSKIFEAVGTLNLNEFIEIKSDRLTT